MGADFKEKSKKSFQKCWDNAAVVANTPDLFCKTPIHSPDRFEAEPIGDADISVGESLNARMEGDSIIARRGFAPVLTITNPSPRLIQSLAEACNIARADVVAADSISGVFEVSIS